MTLFAEEPAPAAEETEQPRTTRCGACRRILTDPAWIALGFGRCCATRLGLIPATGPRVVRLARVRAGGDVEGQGDVFVGEA